MKVLKYTRSLLPPATKLGQGNIVRSVCQEFWSTGVGGGACVAGKGLHGRGPCMARECVCDRGAFMAQRAWHGWGMHGGGACLAGGACMAGGACVAGGHASQRGHVWQRGMQGRGHPWQTLQDMVNERVVLTLL